ncbi:MAG: hypothetical protein AB1714_15620 [Acidobacteriota bacterium]
MGIGIDEAKAALMETLQDLSADDIKELVDFAAYLRNKSHRDGALRQDQLRALPASSLAALTSIASLGGDALRDSEALYDEPSPGRH